MERFFWPSGFRGEDVYIDHSGTQIACGSRVCQRIGTIWPNVIEDFPWMLPTKFRFIWLSGFRGGEFLRNWGISVRFPSEIIYLICVSLNLQNLFFKEQFIFEMRKFFRNRPIRNRNCRWQPCLLTDRHKMCNLVTDWSSIKIAHFVPTR